MRLCSRTLTLNPRGMSICKLREFSKARQYLWISVNPELRREGAFAGGGLLVLWKGPASSTNPPLDNRPSADNL